jgi:hypothetical protein
MENCSGCDITTTYVKKTVPSFYKLNIIDTFPNDILVKKKFRGDTDD